MQGPFKIPKPMENFKKLENHATSIIKTIKSFESTIRKKMTELGQERATVLILNEQLASERKNKDELEKSNNELHTLIIELSAQLAYE